MNFDIFNSLLYKSYILDITRKNGKVLKPEQERILLIKSKNGDLKARDELIKHNLKLVIKIALNYYSLYTNIMDLIQEGNIGLIIAVEKFDIKKNIKFSTYAAYWIKQRIKRFILKNINLYSIPLRKAEKIYNFFNCREKLINEKISIEEAANKVGLSYEYAKNLLFSSVNNFKIFDNFYIMEALFNLNNPEKEIMAKSLREDLIKAINSLPEREREVLKNRFDLNLGEKLSLKKVAKKMNFSPETIRQIEKKAIKKLKERFFSLRDYLEEY